LPNGASGVRYRSDAEFAARYLERFESLPE